MSDFDTVLERLVTDPAFPAQLSADPAAALAGYHLSADEVDLLRSQVSTGDSGGRTVENRTSKASMMGLLGSLGGLGPGAGHDGIGRGIAPHPHEGFGANAPGGETGHAVAHAVGPAEGTAPAPADQIATDYHAHVDATGDGHWDKYVAVRHADGSVDVYEDRNGDGRIDFVGHDANGDGILESADYDDNFDGVADRHLTDVNGDGWMDTTRRATNG
jgi:hypothetical protein